MKSSHHLIWSRMFQFFYGFRSLLKFVSDFIVCNCQNEMISHDEASILAVFEVSINIC